MIITTIIAAAVVVIIIHGLHLHSVVEVLFFSVVQGRFNNRVIISKQERGFPRKTTKIIPLRFQQELMNPKKIFVD